MKTLDTLRQTICTLKGPNGCAWDQNQILGNYARYFQEEVAEVIAAIDANDWVNLKEELSDVLSLLVSVCQMAEDANQFDLDAVAQGAHEKLIRRLPHIFSEHPQVLTEAEVYAQWQRIKAEEKVQMLTHSVDALPSFLKHSGTALHMAQDMCKHLKHTKIPINIPVETHTIQAHEIEACTESSEHILGKALFGCVAATQHSGLDAEKALRSYIYHIAKTI